MKSFVLLLCFFVLSFVFSAFCSPEDYCAALSCSRCLDMTANCVWCSSKARCSRAYECPPSSRTYYCPEPSCHLYSTCSLCVTRDNCGWDTERQYCVNLNSSESWSRSCSSCGNFYTCDACNDRPNCGWCSSAKLCQSLDDDCPYGTKISTCPSETKAGSFFGKDPVFWVILAAGGCFIFLGVSIIIVIARRRRYISSNGTDANGDPDQEYHPSHNFAEFDQLLVRSPFSYHFRNNEPPAYGDDFSPPPYELLGVPFEDKKEQRELGTEMQPTTTTTNVDITTTTTSNPTATTTPVVMESTPTILVETPSNNPTTTTPSLPPPPSTTTPQSQTQERNTEENEGQQN